MKFFSFFLPFIFGCSFSNEANLLTEANAQEPQTQDLIISEIHPTYLWLDNYTSKDCLINRIPVPENYKRVPTDSASFDTWLRHIPLKPGLPQVHLYNGALKNNQAVHAAVFNIDVGQKDLQQCADAVIRLRAEYLLANKKTADLSFNFTSGHPCDYQNWAEGYRPVIKGNDVQFVKSKPVDYSYPQFKNYLDMVFNYCGTYSLAQQMKSKKIADIEIGDVFIYGGFPGHAVIVMDLAQHEETGEKIFLLAQSYMPAQDIHILKNFNNNSLSPWFSANFTEQLNTPEWIFHKSELKQF